MPCSVTAPTASKSPSATTPERREPLWALRRRFLIQVLLKTREGAPDLVRLPQVGDGVGDGVVVLQPQQGRELLLVEFSTA